MRVMTAASVSRSRRSSPTLAAVSIWAARLDHSEIAAIPALPYSTGGGGKAGALAE
jgi:hypothetical protein